MAAWLDEIVAEEKLLLPGHSACAGCGPAINIRHVLGGLAAARPESKIVLVIPASCWTIIAGVCPGQRVRRLRPPDAVRLGGGGGVRRSRRRCGCAASTTRPWSSGAETARPSDIGFSGVSAAAERNEDIIYVLNDNEAYMNTGVQKSGATPEGAWTTTTPAGSPRAGQKKDIARIMAAHGIPYVATLALGSVPMLRDFRAKVARAAEVRGFRFLHVLGALPARAGDTRRRSRPRWRGWRSSRGTSRSSSATTASGGSRSGRSTTLPVRRVPRDAGTLQPPLARARSTSIQSHVDERWDLLAGLEKAL